MCFLVHKLATDSLGFLIEVHHVAPHPGRTGDEGCVRDSWETKVTYSEEVLVSWKSYTQDQTHNPVALGFSPFHTKSCFLISEDLVILQLSYIREDTAVILVLL